MIDLGTLVEATQDFQKDGVVLHSVGAETAVPRAIAVHTDLSTFKSIAPQIDKIGVAHVFEDLGKAQVLLDGLPSSHSGQGRDHGTGSRMGVHT